MTAVRPLLEAGSLRLRAAGSETPRLDAELLLAHAVGTDRTALAAHPEAPVGPEAEARYGELVERRAAGEPVAYLRGWREFLGLALAADPRALVPRPETEQLVELAEREALRHLTAAPRPDGRDPLRIADVGTGSGTIAVALAVLLRRRGALGDVAIVATDVSPTALTLARENAVVHAVADAIEFVEADLLPSDAGSFGLVLANLPYVRRDALPTLPAPTAFEPALALDGGPDGLEVIRRLVTRLPALLEPDGVALLEIGADQAAGIAGLVADALPGWGCDVLPDLADLPRVARIAPPGAHDRGGTRGAG